MIKTKINKIILLIIMLIFLLSVVNATITTTISENGFTLEDDFSTFDTDYWELKANCTYQDGFSRISCPHYGGLGGVMLINDIFKGNPRLEYNISITSKANGASETNLYSFPILMNNSGEMRSGDYQELFHKNHLNSVTGRMIYYQKLNNTVKASPEDNIVVGLSIGTTSRKYEYKKINLENGSSVYKTYYNGVLYQTATSPYINEDFPNASWYFGWVSRGSSLSSVYLYDIKISAINPQPIIIPTQWEADYEESDLPKALINTLAKGFIAITAIIPILILFFIAARLNLFKLFKKF